MISYVKKFWRAWRDFARRVARIFWRVWRDLARVVRITGRLIATGTTRVMRSVRGGLISAVAGVANITSGFMGE